MTRRHGEQKAAACEPRTEPEGATGVAAEPGRASGLRTERPVCACGPGRPAVMLWRSLPAVRAFYIFRVQIRQAVPLWILGCHFLKILICKDSAIPALLRGARVALRDRHFCCRCWCCCHKPNFPCSVLFLRFVCGRALTLWGARRLYCTRIKMLKLYHRSMF